MRNLTQFTLLGGEDEVKGLGCLGFCPSLSTSSGMGDAGAPRSWAGAKWAQGGKSPKYTVVLPDSLLFHPPTSPLPGTVKNLF